MVFSFDVRGRRQFNNALLWSSPKALGPRAFFIAASNPAHLSIDRLETKDEGIYRCRVDFKNSPTRKQKMNLTVIGEWRAFHLSEITVTVSRRWVIYEESSSASAIIIFQCQLCCKLYHQYTQLNYGLRTFFRPKHLRLSKFPTNA